MNEAPRPMQGTWILTAPDGRQWSGQSPLQALRAEQADRIPAATAMERIRAELESPTARNTLDYQLDIANPREEVEVVIDTSPTQRKVTVNVGPVMAARIGNIENLVVRRGDGILLARIKHGETLFNPLLPGNMS